MDAQTPPLDSAFVIDRLGGPSEVARLCECSPQAVSQWFGLDPATQEPRQIPNSRLLFLKAVRADVFRQLATTAGGDEATDTDTPKRAKDVPAAGAGQLRPVKPAGLKNTKVQALEPEAQHD